MAWFQGDGSAGMCACVRAYVRDIARRSLRGHTYARPPVAIEDVGASGP
jgi:hypothetical protein